MNTNNINSSAQSISHERISHSEKIREAKKGLGSRLIRSIKPRRLFLIMRDKIVSLYNRHIKNRSVKSIVPCSFFGNNKKTKIKNAHDLFILTSLGQITKDVNIINARVIRSSPDGADINSLKKQSADLRSEAENLKHIIDTLESMRKQTKHIAVLNAIEASMRCATHGNEIVNQKIAELEQKIYKEDQ